MLPMVVIQNPESVKLSKTNEGAGEKRDKAGRTRLQNEKKWKKRNQGTPNALAPIMKPQGEI